MEVLYRYRQNILKMWWVLEAISFFTISLVKKELVNFTFYFLTHTFVLFVRNRILYKIAHGCVTQHSMCWCRGTEGRLTLETRIST